MNLQRFVFIGLFLVFLSNYIFAQAEKISFWQGGKEIKSNDKGEIRLKRKPFQIKFIVNTPFGIPLYGSMDKAILEESADHRTIQRFKGLGSGDAMAEKIQNGDEDLLISENAYSYWYYEAPDNHRFDKKGGIKKLAGGKIAATRTIKKIFLVADTNRDIALTDKNLKVLYLLIEGTSDLERYSLIFK